MGDIPLFRGPTPQGLRCRGFPYDHSETEFILNKLWKDDDKGRLITASSRSISETDKIIGCPTTTVRKRLPDRRWSEERRPIWDGRFPNLRMPKGDYFSPVLPDIEDITEHIISSKRSYPNVPLKCTKRDINAAFRQIRLRRDACALFPTEFRGLHMGLGFDVIIGYLVLPFGWAGAPGIFASIAELITRYHTLTCPSNSLWAGDRNFRSHLFADDGILIEPDLSGRLEQSDAVWEEGSFMAMGDDALNKEKLGIEGLWSSKQIVLCYELDFELFTINLHGEKIIGAQNLLDSAAFDPGNRIVTLRDIQELRGDMARWQGANLTWRFFAEPVNQMLPFADSTESWIRCSQRGRWRCFWSVIFFFLRNLPRSENESFTWANLFFGSIEELLPTHKRLSGHRQ